MISAISELKLSSLIIIILKFICRLPLCLLIYNREKTLKKLGPNNSNNSFKNKQKLVNVENITYFKLILESANLYHYYLMIISFRL